jgi:hypothetical protein
MVVTAYSKTTTVHFQMKSMGEFNSGRACSVNCYGDVAGIGYDDKKQLRYVIWESRQNRLTWGPQAERLDFIAKINDNKYVLGETLQNDSNNGRAFVWDTTKNTVDYSPDRIDFEPMGFNNSNDVVGAVRIKGNWNPAEPDKNVKAAVWNPVDKNIKIIEKLVQLSAINDRGNMIGTCYLKNMYVVTRIYDSNANVVKFLNLPKDDTWSIVYDIDNSGQAVGYTMKEREYKAKAFLWDCNDKFINLGKIKDRFSLIYGSQTKAYAINNNGQVVGWSSKGVVGPLPLSFYDDGRAFYWDKTNGMLDLNHITINLPKDCQLIEAQDISDSMLIVGWAIDSESNQIPFLLQPVKD